MKTKILVKTVSSRLLYPIINEFCKDSGLRFEEAKNSLKIILVKSNFGLVREYRILEDKKIKVKNGESVIAGQELTSGKISSREILRICGEKKLLEYLTQQILPHLSVANFDERLIELLLRRLLKIEIEEPGETTFSTGQIVDSVQFFSENVLAIKRNKQPAVGMPIFIDIEL